MSFRELIKPTKPKIVGIVFFIIGALLISGLSLLIRIILSRTLTPQEYGLFFAGYKGIIFYGITLLLYLVLIYLSVSIVYAMTKEKK
jgi:hypothetical protein